jgi:hypothetical protein
MSTNPGRTDDLEVFGWLLANPDRHLTDVECLGYVPRDWFTGQTVRILSEDGRWEPLASHAASETGQSA